MPARKYCYRNDYNQISGKGMTLSTIDVDYLVAGAGAAAMAFVDSVLATSQSTFAIVDCRARPGGHWHDAYPFGCTSRPQPTA